MRPLLQESISMKLFYQVEPVSVDAPWLVLIHGLFGSLDNLAVVKRHMASTHNIVSIDLPNHGRSPWSDGFTFDDAVSGIERILDENDIQQAAILGHSLGGKVAMLFALNAPHRVRQLLVADIAPVDYQPRHQAVFAGLQAVDLVTLSNRKDAERQMSQHIVEPGTKQFLLKSLYQDNDQWAWRFNLKGLIESYDTIISWPAPEGTYTGDCLFIKGANSDYITESHRSAIGKWFPNAKAKIINGTGHWLHAEKPTVFNRIVENALTTN